MKHPHEEEKCYFFQHCACRHFSSSVSRDRPPLEMKTTPSLGLIRSAEVFGGVENRKHKIQDKERGEKKQSPIDFKAFNLLNNPLKALHRDCCTNKHGSAQKIEGLITRALFFGCFFTSNVPSSFLILRFRVTNPTANITMLFCRWGRKEPGQLVGGGQRGPSPQSWVTPCTPAGVPPPRAELGWQPPKTLLVPLVSPAVSSSHPDPARRRTAGSG